MLRFLAAALISSLAWGTAFADELPRTGWTAAQVSATRWADSGIVSLDLAPGTEVEVVAEVGDKLRIRSKTSFGWVEASMVTDQAPVSAESVELRLDGAPSFR